MIATGGISRLVKLWLYAETFPLATLAAIVFYGAVLWVLISPGVKRWASNNLVMRALASNQRYLAPLDVFRDFAAL